MARSLTGVATIRGTDDEWWPFTDESVERTTPFGLVLNVDQPAVLLDLPAVRWGGECRVELEIFARAVSSGNVQIEGKAKLFEGTSEDTDDLEHEENITFLVPRNTTAHTTATRHEIQLRSSGPGGGDHAEITLSCMNVLIEED